MILTSIAILLLHFSNAVVIHVDTCPNKESWLERSSRFKCKEPNEVYHCIKSSDGRLLETCMKSYVIKSYKVGCPYVHIHNGISYLRSPFLACDLMSHGCPKAFHEEYSTNELYLYPACIAYDGSTTSHKGISFITNVTDEPDSDTVGTSRTTNIVPVILGSFVSGMCLGFIIMWIAVKVLYRRQCREKPATSWNRRNCAASDKQMGEFDTLLSLYERRKYNRNLSASYDRPFYSSVPMCRRKLRTARHELQSHSD